MTASKRKGTTFEVALRDTLATLLDRTVHRLGLSGTRDIGDLFIEGIDVTIEAKAAKALELGSWMTETLTEQVNRDTRWSALIVKRRMKPIDKSFVVMELDQWCDLVDAAHWRPEPPIEFPRPRLVEAGEARARATHPTARPVPEGA